jgi:uncharacterized protein (DUF4415 family)
MSVQDIFPADFQQAAAPADSQAAPTLVTVSLPVDATVVEWFKGKLQPTDWQHHMAEVLQFYMETNQPRPGRMHGQEPGI